MPEEPVDHGPLTAEERSRREELLAELRRKQRRSRRTEDPGDSAELRARRRYSRRRS